MSEEELRLPRHIAIIMDGNGRWGEEHGVGRSGGHREGVRIIEPIVRRCGDLGIESLTLFALSTENWKRPKSEVETLMELMREFFHTKLLPMFQAGVRIRVLGERASLPAMQRSIIERAEAMTADNRGISLNIAFNYGSRSEIVNAAKRLAAKVAQAKLAVDDISQERFEEELYTADLPPVDLLIRTGGETRVSNFLLYQLAYAELSFIPEYWPDFSETILLRELQRYGSRERRFGGLGTQE